MCLRTLLIKWGCYLILHRMEHVIILQIDTVLIWCRSSSDVWRVRSCHPNKNEAILDAARSSSLLNLLTTCHSLLKVMKTFIVQSLALIGTVLFIMEAASKPHPNKTELRRIIIHDATEMSKNVRGKVSGVQRVYLAMYWRSQLFSCHKISWTKWLLIQH